MLIAFLKDGLLNAIIEFDRWLLIKINNDWSNSFCDSIFPVYRHSDFWIPLYFFLFIFMILNFGWRSFFWMLFLGLTAGICDQISSGLIKDMVGRIRPCGDSSLVG